MRMVGGHRNAPEVSVVCPPVLDVLAFFFWAVLVSWIFTLILIRLSSFPLSTHTLAHSGYPCVAHYALIPVVILIALLLSYVLPLVPHPLSHLSLPGNFSTHPPHPHLVSSHLPPPISSPDIVKQHLGLYIYPVPYILLTNRYCIVTFPLDRTIRLGVDSPAESLDCWR